MAIISIVFLISLFFQPSELPENIKLLMKHYPQIKSYRDGKLIFQDNSSILYDDLKQKTHNELLDNADMEDMFYYTYPRSFPSINIPKNHDPGRIRNDLFFKKIYGSTKAEVEKNLVEINWCPKLVHQKIKVTKINGVSAKIKAISDELDQHPEYKKYIQNIGGTFNWRKINGTNRMSLHSYGMTIDINIKYSDYWQWQSKSTDENISLKYKNKIPEEIVEIFEKHGFIWGGKWYHYDTMHFEYRPEML
jgi:hypothetical protein